MIFELLNKIFLISINIPSYHLLFYTKFINFKIKKGNNSKRPLIIAFLGA